MAPTNAILRLRPPTRGFRKVQTTGCNVRNSDPLDLSFANPHDSFKSKTSLDLIRALIVYQLCSSTYLVNNNLKLMKFTRSILGSKLFEALMKVTLYGHFVGGENKDSIISKLEHLSSFGVKSILYYSVEDDLSQTHETKLNSTNDESKSNHVAKLDRSNGRLCREIHEKNGMLFEESLHAVANATRNNGDGVAAIKLTALCKPQILVQLSEAVLSARSFSSTITNVNGNILNHGLKIEELEKYLVLAGIRNNDLFLKNITSDEHGIIHLLPWYELLNSNLDVSESFCIPCLTKKKLIKLFPNISKDDTEIIQRLMHCLNKLAQTAKKLNIRLIVDAEQTYFQPAISRLTLELMRKYNTDRGTIVNSYQCYLKQTLDEVKADLEQARRQNFYIGLKLVRGAYMDLERSRARSLNYPDPIHSSYEITTKMYHNAFSICLERVKQLKETEDNVNKVTIVVASHNEDTVRFVLQKMKEINISSADKAVCFGQLYGMRDFITFPLGQAGYSAYKCMPYGPVDKVMPYLSRRVTENRTVISKLEKEKKLLKGELWRRIKNGSLFYAPKGDYRTV